MESTVTSVATGSLISATLLAISTVIAARRGWYFLSNKAVDAEESEDEFVDGEEELLLSESLPEPEPLGGSLAPPKRFALSSAPVVPAVTVQSHHRHGLRYHTNHFSFEKTRYEMPLDTDAAALRAKLIDADAAKRRAMTRLAELEKETETLKHKCAELERRVMGDHLHTFGKMMNDSLQSMGIGQRLLSLAVPQLKYRRRGVMWKT